MSNNEWTVIIQGFENQPDVIQFSGVEFNFESIDNTLRELQGQCELTLEINSSALDCVNDILMWINDCARNTEHSNRNVIINTLHKKYERHSDISSPPHTKNFIYSWVLRNTKIKHVDFFGSTYTYMNTRRLSNIVNLKLAYEHVDLDIREIIVDVDETKEQYNGKTDEHLQKAL